MQYIVGLGNPGAQYQHSRHNVGWQYLEYLRSEVEAPDFSPKAKFHAELSVQSPLVLCKPTTYMNNSGRAVAALVQFYEKDRVNTSFQQHAWDNVCVVHDDLDIPLGSCKLQFGTGPKVHNGINSIREYIGTDFWYLRIGVDGRAGLRTLPGHEYVLQPFLPAERVEIEKVFSAATTELRARFLSI